CLMPHFFAACAIAQDKFPRRTHFSDFDLDEAWSVLLQRSPERASKGLRRIRFIAGDAECLSHFRKSRILQFRSDIAAVTPFFLMTPDIAELAVVEDDHRQI